MTEVAIIGGGLAGISAAVALGEAGARVRLFEARPRLGGATHSFVREGLTVDNGQHVFLKCCTAYQELLRRMGVADQVTVQDRFDVPVLAPDGRTTRLRRTNTPGPTHFGPALARYPLLPLRDRLGTARAALAMMRLDPADPALDRQALGAWLSAHGQGERAQQALWDLFVVSGLNVRTKDASLGLAAKLIKTGLLGARDAADIGVPSVPLGELHGEAAAKTLAGLGADVRTRAKVTAIERRDGGGFRVLADGERHPADAVILAVPHPAAAALVPRAAVPEAGEWAGLGAAPIVNVHVIYDRTVMPHPYAAAVDSPVQWVFDRTRIAGLRSGAHGDGQYLAVSVSAAEAYIDRRVADLREVFLPALGRLFPVARAASVRDFFVTRERTATFCQAPGTRALRPQAATRMPGLYIAGAWTDTGWPDTMEGAVRSGLQAARLVRRLAPSTTRPRGEQAVRAGAVARP
ncbi:MAG TPA: hydroxysqualene dehydroxylase HpnE [Streptosporangiaceae bacterium]